MSAVLDTWAQPSAPAYYDRWKHHEVGVRIRICEEYIVHIDVRGKLDWEVIDKPEPHITEAQAVELNSAYCDIVVNEKRSLEGYTPEQREHYLTILGEAYVHWIERDVSTVKRLVQAAKKYYQERSEETSRRWYLNATIRVFGLCLLAGLLAWITQDAVIRMIGSHAFKIGLSAVAGTIGALFSVIARSGKLKFNASAGRNLHELEAASRIAAGAISGVIIYLALSSEIILGALLKNSHRTEIALLASIAAGAGERLATSIISKFDESKLESLNETSD